MYSTHNSCKYLQKNEKICQMNKNEYRQTIAQLGPSPKIQKAKDKTPQKRRNSRKVDAIDSILF